MDSAKDQYISYSFSQSSVYYFTWIEDLDDGSIAFILFGRSPKI